MRKIKLEIERCMTGPEKTDGTLTSRFLFPPEFIGFQGHFPLQKVLPGACQIQCALTTMEKGLGRVMALREIVLAKFMAPVLPDQEITCAVSDCNDTDGEWLCRVRITRDNEKVSDLKLRVATMAQGGNRHP